MEYLYNKHFLIFNARENVGSYAQVNRDFRGHHPKEIGPQFPSCGQPPGNPEEDRKLGDKVFENIVNRRLFKLD